MFPRRYTLYKQPIQTETLAIVQYLYHEGYNALPTVIIERCIPKQLELPCIYDYETNELHEGLDACIAYYEQNTSIVDLAAKATAFKEANPSYRIH